MRRATWVGASRRHSGRTTPTSSAQVAGTTMRTNASRRQTPSMGISTPPTVQIHGGSGAITSNPARSTRAPSIRPMVKPNPVAIQVDLSNRRVRWMRRWIGRESGRRSFSAPTDMVSTSCSNRLGKSETFRVKQEPLGGRRRRGGYGLRGGKPSRSVVASGSGAASGREASGNKFPESASIANDGAAFVNRVVARACHFRPQGVSHRFAAPRRSCCRPMPPD